MADALPLWSIFQPDRADPTPLQEQIAGFFRTAVADGRLGPGARLPSSRGLAIQLGVARNTVSLAYERLTAEGYVEGRRGGGTRIATDLPELSTPKPADRKIGMPIETPRLSRAAEKMMAERVGVAGDGPVPLRPGRPGLDAFPGRVWGRLAGRFWRETSPADFGYGDPAGHAPLRAALSRYLGAFRGLAVKPDQILVTSGAQQAVDMLSRALLDPDDKAVLEEPCYPGLRGPIAATGAEIVPVPVDSEGLNVAEARRRAPDARLVVVTPTHQFPLGCTLSLARRRALVDWAASESDAGLGSTGGKSDGQAGPWIVEDDYDGEFRYGGKPVPPLKSLDGAGKVLYVGTISKALAPSLRLGFIAAPTPVASVLVRLRAHFDRQPALDAQAILADFLDEGHMAGHLRRMRTLYRERRDALADALDEVAADLDHGLGEIIQVERPETGINLIVLLPDHISDTRVVAAAESLGVQPAALSGYYRGASVINGLLIGFAALPRARARWAARCVGQAIRMVM